MKHLRLVLILSALAVCTVRAQRDPEPIPDFSNLDEYTYEPKTILTLGVRNLGGVKTSFRGQGLLKSPENPGNATDGNISRTYHDGTVQPDGRVILVDSGNGTPIATPITPDGKTNSWNFIDNRQATAFPGYIAMHTYSAAIVDPRVRYRDGASSMGLELAVARDMGKLFNTRFSWDISGGVTINDISAASTDRVRASLSTLTDLYSLYGETAPNAPYRGPSSVTTTVNDSSGNPILNPDGTTQTVTTDTTVLIGNTPIRQGPATTTDDTSVTHRSKLRGAYYTFRAGPTLWMPISNRLRASLSLGATVIYAGSKYTLVQSFQPETGAEIKETLEGEESRFLPGYYADATLQFDITQRTGLYAGAVFQSSGDYTQSVGDGTGTNYSTKIDFGNQQGFRAGMTIRF